MDRIVGMNIFLIAVVISAWTILDHVALAVWMTDVRWMWVSFILVHFLAGIFLGFAMFKAGEDRLEMPMLLTFSILIILFNMVLTAKLLSTLKCFASGTMLIRNVIGALAAISLGFGIPFMSVVLRGRGSKASFDDGPPPDLKITDVIIEETGIRCPICDIFPEEEGHYIIRCYRCNAEFCSKHLDQYEERCWRCRTPIPFLKELKQALKENQLT